MADNVRLICEETPDYPALALQLKNLAGQAYRGQATLMQLDTGYSEELLIPQSVFATLQLERWYEPSQAIVQAKTITGQSIKMRAALAEVVIPQTALTYRVTVQTFAGNARFLIGRAFLRRFKVVLDGPGGLTCLMQSADA